MSHGVPLSRLDLPACSMMKRSALLKHMTSILQNGGQPPGASSHEQLAQPGCWACSGRPNSSIVLFDVLAVQNKSL